MTTGQEQREQDTKERLSRCIHQLEDNGYGWLGPILRRAIFVSPGDWEAIRKEMRRHLPGDGID